MNMINDSEKRRRARIITLGCRVNQYESRALAEALQKYGIYTDTDAEDELPADVCIVNTCAVTAESERKSRQMIRRLIRANPGAVIAAVGCASQLAPEEISAIKGVSLVGGCRNKSLFAAQIAVLLDGKAVSPAPEGDSFSHDAPLLDCPISGFDRVRAYVKIEDGCDGRCAYCVIPKARGHIVSRRPEDIVAEVETLAQAGCREIVLTGIETSAYGYGLAELIASVDRVEGVERIRLGSMDPAFMKPAFIEAVAGLSHFMPHFHLSLQSGCSRVLALMRRKYNAEAAMKVIDDIRSALPDANLSADLICGFPGETEEDFSETLDFCGRARLLHAHIFTYSTRPGTEACEMDGQLDESVKNERSARLSELQKQIKGDILARAVENGHKASVLVETLEDCCARGHTRSFIEAKFPASGDLRGHIIDVLPVSSDGDSLLCVRADK